MTTTPTSMSQDSGTGPSPKRSSSPSRALSFWEGVNLVARRDILMQVRSRAFQVSFIITLLLVGGGIVAMGIFSQQSFGSGDAPTVAVTSESAPIAEDAGLGVTVVDSNQAALDAVTSEQVDSAVLPASALNEITVYDSSGNEAEVAEGSGMIVIGASEPSGGVTDALTTTPEGYSIEQPTAAPWLVYILTIFFGIMFFMSAISYCSTIAQSIVEEKQTRIVELLLATVSARTIMAGKVLGNSLLALVQVAAIGVVSLVALAATGQSALFALVGPAIIWFAVLFIFGFVLLAALYAGVAATVSRQEDVATATMPLMFVIMIPYILSFVASSNPTLMTVMSYVPFSAPIAMPVRVFTGEAAWFEPLLALALLIATAAVAIWFGAKLYENAVLRTGARIKLKDALKG